jgi:hypothetical protein
MRAKPRKDDVIMKQSHQFYDEDAATKGEWTEMSDERRDARLVLRFIQDYIGDERFVEYFKYSVQYDDDEWWAVDVMFALSRDDDDEEDKDDHANDEIDRDHEFALRLGRAVLETLQLRAQRLLDDDDDRPPIKYLEEKILHWADTCWSLQKRKSCWCSIR